MKKLYWLAAYALATVPVLALTSSESPCIEDGEAREIEFDRPPIDAPGMPTDASWEGGTGNPRGEEDDPFVDDDLGPASGSDPASVTIENDGGDLKDSSGNVQNGGTEGDCIEVRVCWWIRHKVTIGRATSSGYEANGSTSKTTESESHTVWRRRRVCSPTKKVCPC